MKTKNLKSLMVPLLWHPKLRFAPVIRPIGVRIYPDAMRYSQKTK